jgi:hypothetical protein
MCCGVDLFEALHGAIPDMELDGEDSKEDVGTSAVKGIREDLMKGAGARALGTQDFGGFPELCVSPQP